MKIPKTAALEYIRNAMQVGHVTYSEDVIDAMTYVALIDRLQDLERKIEKSPLTVFEGED